MHKRKGSYGVYDHGDWTVALGGSHFADGPHRPYTVTLHHRVHGPRGGLAIRSRSLTVPTLRFSLAFRLRRLGALHLYRWQERLLRVGQ